MGRVIPLNVQFSFLSYLFPEFTDFTNAGTSSVEASCFLTRKHRFTSISNSICRTELLDEILPASQDASKLNLIFPPHSLLKPQAPFKNTWIQWSVIPWSLVIPNFHMKIKVNQRIKDSLNWKISLRNSNCHSWIWRENLRTISSSIYALFIVQLVQNYVHCFILHHTQKFVGCSWHVLCTWFNFFKISFWNSIMHEFESI